MLPYNPVMLGPIDLAASTYKDSFAESVTLRIILANDGVPKTATAITTLDNPGPKIATIPMASNRSGKENMTSLPA